MAGDVPSFRINHMPCGGQKIVACDPEGLRHAIEEMTPPKLLGIDLRSGLSSYLLVGGDSFSALLGWQRPSLLAQ
ncbi:MAG: hypothetical protein JO249_16530 [Acidobacteria bacterium]|nr:hypothetical protein [Acidobacteriota bacterium]